MPGIIGFYFAHHQYSAGMVVGVKKGGFTAFLPPVQQVGIVNVGFVVVNVNDLCSDIWRFG